MFQQHRAPQRVGLAMRPMTLASHANLIDSTRKGRANGPMARACAPPPTSPGLLHLASRRSEQLTQLNLLLCHRPPQLFLGLPDPSPSTAVPVWTNTRCLARRYFLSLFVFEIPPPPLWLVHKAHRNSDRISMAGLETSARRKVLKVIFVSLLLDLVISPLPRLLCPDRLGPRQLTRPGRSPSPSSCRSSRSFSSSTATMRPAPRRRTPCSPASSAT